MRSTLNGRGRWLRQKEALDKPHSSGSCASAGPRRVNKVTQAHSSSVITLGVCVCVSECGKKTSHTLQKLDCCFNSPNAPCLMAHKLVTLVLFYITQL